MWIGFPFLALLLPRLNCHVNLENRVCAADANFLSHTGVPCYLIPVSCFFVVENNTISITI
jgi:hypothetical protein